MSFDLLLTKVRLTLLEVQIYDTPEKREIYLGALQRLAIELSGNDTVDGSAEMIKLIENFIEEQRKFFNVVAPK